MRPEILDLYNSIIASRGTPFKGVHKFRTKEEFEEAKENGLLDKDTFYIVEEEHDYSVVYVNGKTVGVFDADTKQDVLTFDGEYNAETNPAATVQSIEERVKGFVPTETYTADKADINNSIE